MDYGLYQEIKQSLQTGEWLDLFVRLWREDGREPYYWGA